MDTGYCIKSDYFKVIVVVNCNIQIVRQITTYEKYSEEGRNFYSQMDSCF